MRHGHFSARAGLLLVTVLLGSCGSGNSTDVFPWAETAAGTISGPNSFLLFPNPQAQWGVPIDTTLDSGSLQTNTTAYATAYYEAIDPTNVKDTLAKWKLANHFGDSTTGTETWVVFGDVKDLGYGRRMTARQNTDGSIAVMVENYLVSPAVNYTYSSFNLDAAVASDQRWHVGTNGIEFSPATCVTGDLSSCDPSIRFAKFYTFDAATGQRKLVADLDGRGDKAMPGICISCHGGRAYPLTPAAGSLTGKALFNLLGNTASQKRGDVEAHLQMLNVDSFDFSSMPGYTRADQEAKLKTINQWVLSSYPIETATGLGVDASRRAYVYGEWGGDAAAAVIKAAYGGGNMPNPTFSDTYVPASWQTPALSTDQTSLYTGVVVPACRTCHILRGTTAMDDLNFNNYCTESSGVCDPAAFNSYFFGYAGQIKHHVIDKGNMPLAKIVYERFWSTGEADTMANFLQPPTQTDPVRDSGGAVLKPGRPVAVPGPDRTTLSGVTLSAANSLYASTYTWSVVSGTGVLSNANTASPTLTGSNGSNVLRLVVGNGTVQSDPVQVTITIDSTMGTGGKLTATPHFADIKAVLQGPAGCYGCHYPGGGPPIFYTDIDRNGDGLVQIAPGSPDTDDQWFYTELRGRINFTDVANSPLLRKPTGHHHGGGNVLDFTYSGACGTCGAAYTTYGAYYAAAYNMFVNWILNGAPY